MAYLVWEHLGDVANYIEPFAGSAAVLLSRPHPPRVETLNDADCYVANFWRATALDPDGVVEHCNWPVSEIDLHARHRWLMLSPAAIDFRDRMRDDPGYFDSRVAGWWCWGLCMWIGSGWCQTQVTVGSEGSPPPVGRSLSVRRPFLGGWGNGGGAQEGRGIHAKGTSNPAVGRRPQLADAFARGRGVHSNDSAETCGRRRAWLLDWFGRLRDRLRSVRVCCGDWLRVCDSPSVTTRLGTTGIFFDPPYSTESGRTKGLYGVDCGRVAHDVRAYCLERGTDPRMRIVLAGYEGEGHEELERHGWRVLAWATQGGYGNQSEHGRANAKKERLWISPHCSRRGQLTATPLFPEGIDEID